jgi:hypothetical protein
MKIHAKAKLERFNSDSKHEAAKRNGSNRRRKKAISQQVKHHNDVTDHDLHFW